MNKTYYVVSPNVFENIKTINETEISHGSRITKYIVDEKGVLWENSTTCIGQIFHTQKEADRYRLFLIDEEIRKESTIIQSKNKSLSELKSLSLEIAIKNIQN